MKDRLFISRTLLPATLVVLYLASVLLAAFLSYERVASLSSHKPIDYTYYMQFAAKALDGPEGFFMVHTIGTNIVYKGPDGKADPYKGIHFEPYRYITVALFALFASPLPIFVFYALLFFSPLLYGAFLMRKGAAQEELALVLFAYALAPPVMFVALNDLRPFTALIPFFALFSLAVLYARPLSEKLMFLVLLFFAREEGLILATPGIVFLMLTELRHRLAWKETIPVVAVWLAGLLVVVAYFFWIADAYQLARPWVATLLLVCSGVGIVAAVLMYCLRERSVRLQIPSYLTALSWSVLLFLPILGMKLAGMMPEIFPPRFVYTRFGFLVWLIALLMLLAVFIEWRHPRIKKFVFAALGALALIGGVLQFTGPLSTWGLHQGYRAAIPDAQAVHAERMRVPSSTLLILDIFTQQDFYTHDSVIVLVPIPNSPVLNPEDYYPNNRETVAAVITRSPDTVAIVDRSTEAVLLDVVQASGKEPELLWRNEQYVAYAIVE